MYEAEHVTYNYSSYPLKFKDCFHEHKDIIVHIDNMSVTKNGSTLFEFGINQSYKTALMVYFVSRPRVSSKKYLIYPFNQGLNANELDIIGQFSMINCKEVDVLFSPYPTDTTCFFNLCLENFVVRFNGKNYQNITTSAISVDFYKAQRSICLLDSLGMYRIK
jgi:hypothetical protein